MEQEGDPPDKLATFAQAVRSTIAALHPLTNDDLPTPLQTTVTTILQHALAQLRASPPTPTMSTAQPTVDGSQATRDPPPHHQPHPSLPIKPSYATIAASTTAPRSSGPSHQDPTRVPGKAAAQLVVSLRQLTPAARSSLELSPRELGEVVRRALGTTPAHFKSARALKSGDVLLTFATVAAADTARLASSTWLPHLHAHATLGRPQRTHAAVVHLVPTCLDAAEVAHMIEARVDAKVAHISRIPSRTPGAALGSVKVLMEDAMGARKVLEMEELVIGGSKTRTEGFVPMTVPRCYRCSRWGHVRRDCNAAGPTCGYCASKHELSTCESTSARCVNCEDHVPSWHSECPVRLSAKRPPAVRATHRTPLPGKGTSGTAAVGEAALPALAVAPPAAPVRARPSGTRSTSSVSSDTDDDDDEAVASALRPPRRRASSEPASPSPARAHKAAPPPAPGRLAPQRACGSIFKRPRPVPGPFPCAPGAASLA